MKNTLKAVRIYMKAAFNPIVSLIGLAMAIGIIIGAAFENEQPGSKEYVSMLGALGFGHLGLFMLFFIGTISISASKYYTSLPVAKQIYTEAPVFLSIAAGIVYDIIIAVVLWNKPSLTDAVIINAIETVLFCLILNVVGKRSLRVIFYVLYIPAFVQSPLLNKIPALRNGLGLNLGTSIAAAAAVYIIGTAFVLCIVKKWWNSSRLFSFNSYNGQNLPASE